MSVIFPANYSGISTKSEDDMIFSAHTNPLIPGISPSVVIKNFHDFKVPKDGTLKLCSSTPVSIYCIGTREPSVTIVCI